MLLQSLFDGHPGTIVTPGVFLWYFYYFFEQNSTLAIAQLIDRFIQDFEVIFDGSASCVAYSPNVGIFSGLTTLGANRDECVQVSKEVFRNCLLGILADYRESVPRKLFFQAVHVAYRYALGQPGKIDIDTRIVFPIHAPIPNKVTSQFAEDFPDAKYVLMVRKPIETVASTIRFQTGIGGYLLFLDCVLLPALFGGVPTTNGVEANTKAVRLEDLHAAPRETMEKLCEWLDLPWDESLMKSTFNGKDWWGDGSSLQVNGFSENIVAKRHAQQLPQIDVLRLNVLLASKSEQWGYQIPDADRGALRKLLILPLLLVPFSMEVPFLLALRQEKLSFSMSKLPAERFPRLLKYLYWFCGMGTIVSYFEIRKHLLGSWLGTFATLRSEVTLLELGK